jgi:hypothetical protein
MTCSRPDLNRHGECFPGGPTGTQVRRVYQFRHYCHGVERAGFPTLPWSPNGAANRIELLPRYDPEGRYGGLIRPHLLSVNGLRVRRESPLEVLPPNSENRPGYRQQRSRINPLPDFTFSDTLPLHGRDQWQWQQRTVERMGWSWNARPRADRLTVRAIRDINRRGEGRIEFIGSCRGAGRTNFSATRRNNDARNQEHRNRDSV